MSVGRGRATLLQRSLSSPSAPGVRPSEERPEIVRRVKRRLVKSLTFGNPRIPRQLSTDKISAGDNHSEVSSLSSAPEPCQSKQISKSEPVHVYYKIGEELVVITTGSNGTLKDHLLSHIQDGFNRSLYSLNELNGGSELDAFKHISLSIGNEKLLITGSEESSLRIQIHDYLQATEQELIQRCKGISLNNNYLSPPAVECSKSAADPFSNNNSYKHQQMSDGKSPPKVSQAVQIPEKAHTAPSINGTSEDWDSEVAGEERPVFHFGAEQFKYSSVAVNNNAHNISSEWNRLASNKTKKELRAEMFTKMPNRPRPQASAEVEAKVRNRDTRLFDDKGNDINGRDDKGSAVVPNHIGNLPTHHSNQTQKNFDSITSKRSIERTMSADEASHAYACDKEFRVTSAPHTADSVRQAIQLSKLNTQTVDSVFGSGDQITQPLSGSLNAQIENSKSLSLIPPSAPQPNFSSTLSSQANDRWLSSEPAFSRSNFQLQKLPAEVQRNNSRDNWETAKEDNWRKRVSLSTNDNCDVQPVKPNINSRRPLYSREDLLALSNAKSSHAYSDSLFIQPVDFLIVRDVIMFTPASNAPPRKYFTPADLKTPDVQAIVQAVFIPDALPPDQPADTFNQELVTPAVC